MSSLQSQYFKYQCSDMMGLSLLNSGLAMHIFLNQDRFCSEWQKGTIYCFFYLAGGYTFTPVFPFLTHITRGRRSMCNKCIFYNYLLVFTWFLCEFVGIFKNQTHQFWHILFPRYIFKKYFIMEILDSRTRENKIMCKK